MAKKKSYYITAAIFVLISGFFSQYIKYEVESFRFLKIFMNKYADTVIYLEQKNSTDSFFTKKSKAVKMRKELGEKISRINKYAGSEAGNEPEFLSDDSSASLQNLQGAVFLKHEYPCESVLL